MNGTIVSVLLKAVSNPTPFLASPLKGEESRDFPPFEKEIMNLNISYCSTDSTPKHALPFKGRVRVGMGFIRGVNTC